MSLREYLRELRPHAVWDAVRWLGEHYLLPLVPLMVAGLVSSYQWLSSQPVSVWLVIAASGVSLVLFIGQVLIGRRHPRLSAKDVRTVVQSLIERRERAVLYLLHMPVRSDRDLERWVNRWELWRKEVVGLLRRVCSSDEVSRFEVIGLYRLENSGHAYNDEHNHKLAQLTRDLEVLLEIIDSLTDSLEEGPVSYPPQ
jgi:hypothetical protein